MNAYIALINFRSLKLGLKNVYAFNTFFFTMIEAMHQKGTYSFPKLLRIITKKKINLIDFSYILLPVNIEHYHWFLMVIDLNKHTVHLLDSMNTGKTHEDAKQYLFIV